MAPAASGGGDRDWGSVVKRRSDLTSPRHRYRFDVSYDAEAFGQFSESIARYLGTARFLVWQTVVVILWLAFNLLPPERYQFDPWNRGLVLLTLVLSLQASYAAPLILLAGNRQATRDRLTLEHAAEETDVAEEQNKRLLEGNTEILKRMENLESLILYLQKRSLERVPSDG